jgi:ATP-binding cassette subfamily B protein
MTAAATPMGERSTFAAIVRELLTSYPRHFALLFLTLVVEGIVETTAVLAIVPVADFLIDPTLAKPSRVTLGVLNMLAPWGVHAGFWTFGLIFVAANLVKGGLDIATKYSILRIKYAVTRGLFGGALTAFFRARWEFFSAADQGRLLNTLNRELNTIGDTLGHLATQLAQLVQLCIYLMVPFWLNARMTLIALVLAMLLSSPLLLLQRLSYRLGRRNTETANVMMGVLSEVLSAARLILGFGRQAESRDRFINAFDNHVHVTLRSQTVTTAA